MTRGGQGGNGGGGVGSVYYITAGIVGFLAFLLSLFNVINPKADTALMRQEMREDLRRSEDKIEKTIKEVNSIVLTKAEHYEYKGRTDDALKMLQEEIRTLRADQVTRAEQQQHWNDTGDRLAALRDRALEDKRANDLAISELAKNIGSQVTIGDQFKDMRDQIKALQGQLWGMNRRPIDPPRPSSQ